MALTREYSDHSLVILSTPYLDFIPLSFHFYNSWMLWYGLESLVSKSWRYFDGVGAPDRYLSNKLKFLKDEIRRWRSIESEKENKAFIDLKEKVINLDLAVGLRLLIETELVLD